MSQALPPRARFNVLVPTAHGSMIVNRNDWQDTPQGRVGVGRAFRQTLAGRLAPVGLIQNRPEAGGVELLEDAAAVAARVQGLAQRRIEVAQQAGAQQEIADLGALPVEHVFGQEVGDGAVAA